MKKHRFWHWDIVPFGFRGRIMAVYLLLILIAFSSAIFAIRRVLLLRLEERIEQALQQEVQELRLLISGKDPNTAEPFGEDITAIFDVYLSRNIPEADEYFITLLPNGFYNSSPLALPPSIERNSEIVKHWQQLTQPEQGEIDQFQNRIVYLAEPKKINGKIRGVFVIAIAAESELQEIDEATLIITQITIIVIIITTIFAWILTGQVLAPLRLLTNTTQAISETNLERRIPVQGNDEIAQLSITFNEMLNRLQSAFHNQRHFLNDISHELRTPITIIQGHLELIGSTPEEQSQTLELVMDELKRMSRLVADLMLLAKSEQPNFLHLETVQLSKLTEEMYDRSTVLADRNWHLEQVGSGLIVVDRQRLIQAIVNLAQNATKHTQVTDVIALGSEINQGYVRFWIADTGTGISLSEQSQIFERFIKGTNSRNSEGTGLGLAIVKAIIQAHKGKIELCSQPGKGAKFTLILPVDTPINYN
ncbi:two-component sensor histidine kinase [Stanieria sp. NIES-3757]|nr:two-component sensor histidine kinase [Stanieria sp. NIES-3757]